MRGLRVLPRSAVGDDGAPLVMWPGGSAEFRRRLMTDPSECGKCHMDDEPMVRGWLVCQWCYELIKVDERLMTPAAPARTRREWAT